MGSALLTAADVVDRIVAGLCRVVVLVTAVVLTVVMTANVVARYLLTTGGFSFAQELPTLFFPWFIAAGIVLAAISGTHMAVEWIYGKLSSRGNQALFVAMSVMVSACFVILCWQALSVAEIASAERSPILRLPNSIGYYSVAVMAALVTVVTLTQALRVGLLGWEARQPANTEDLPV
ncbi:TRAP transporter small permease subunit [Devosia sp. 1566]|uniref:TRAP transporter small permease n=1 Tax=Devosia sp. 1566 TaxID=2499144 RepID=UPI000FDB0113|nr:TRAP transporter small permease subunit [Devosia sp. 1566]